MAKAEIDVSEWIAGLNRLADPALRTSLARSMAVAGGKVLRDEAKLQAPMKSGLLKSAIYLAYRDAQSTDEQVTYRITWNATKAPHGHLLEFGHWRYNMIINGRPQKSLRDGLKRGKGPADHVPPGALDVPVWVNAKPFLRPAFDVAGADAQKAMVERGRQRLPELLRGGGDES